MENTWVTSQVNPTPTVSNNSQSVARLPTHLVYNVVHSSPQRLISAESANTAGVHVSYMSTCSPSSISQQPLGLTVSPGVHRQQAPRNASQLSNAVTPSPRFVGIVLPGAGDSKIVSPLNSTSVSLTARSGFPAGASSPFKNQEAQNSPRLGGLIRPLRTPVHTLTRPVASPLLQYQAQPPVVLQIIQRSLSGLPVPVNSPVLTLPVQSPQLRTVFISGAGDGARLSRSAEQLQQNANTVVPMLVGASSSATSQQHLVVSTVARGVQQPSGLLRSKILRSSPPKPGRFPLNAQLQSSLQVRPCPIPNRDSSPHLRLPATTLQQLSNQPVHSGPGHEHAELVVPAQEKVLNQSFSPLPLNSSAISRITVTMARARVPGVLTSASTPALVLPAASLPAPFEPPRNVPVSTTAAVVSNSCSLSTFATLNSSNCVTVASPVATVNVATNQLLSHVAGVSARPFSPVPTFSSFSRHSVYSVSSRPRFPANMAAASNMLRAHHISSIASQPFVRGSTQMKSAAKSRLTKRGAKQPAVRNVIPSSAAASSVNVSISSPELLSKLMLARKLAVSLPNSAAASVFGINISTTTCQPTTSTLSSSAPTLPELHPGICRGKRYCLFLETGEIYTKVFCAGEYFQMTKPVAEDLPQLANSDSVATPVAAGGDIANNVEKKEFAPTVGSGGLTFCASCRVFISGSKCIRCSRPTQSGQQGCQVVFPRFNALQQTVPCLPAVGSSPRNPSSTLLTQFANSSANIRSYMSKRYPGKRQPRATKRAEPEVVHILSSDDEEDKSASAVPNSQPPLSVESVMPAAASQPEFNPQISSVFSQAGSQIKESAADAVLPVLPSQPDLLSIKARCVRVGSLMLSRVQECVFFTQALRITFTPEGSLGLCNLALIASDMRVMRVHFGPSGPVVFLLMSPESGKRTRNLLNLTERTACYYDPESNDDSLKYILIIPQQSVISEEQMVAMVSRMQSTCPSATKFMYESLTPDITKSLLCSIMKNNHMAPSATPAAQSSSVSAPGASVTPGAPRFLLSTPTAMCILTPSSQLRFVIGQKLEVVKMANVGGQIEDDDSEEMADRSRSPSPPHPIFSGPVVRLFIYPPPPATGGITVTNEDFYCLNDGEFLNDVIIDFYLKYLAREILKAEDQSRTHIFSSFFYRRLTQKDSRGSSVDDRANLTLQQRRHMRVKTWTRHVDLFSKDFILVPINESAHWYLAVICFPGLRDAVVVNDGPASQTNNDADSDKSKESTGDKDAVKRPCILIFDSLMTQHFGVICTLRGYLQEEWNARKTSAEGAREFTKDNFPGTCVQCPQQTNYSDCGVYVLQYAESFFMNPVHSYAFPFGSLLNWFSEEHALKKREALRQLVLNLQKTLNPDLQYDPQQGMITAHPAPESANVDQQPTALVADGSFSVSSDANAEPMDSGQTSSDANLVLAAPSSADEASAANMGFQTVTDDRLAECTQIATSIASESFADNMEFQTVTDDNLTESTEPAPLFVIESFSADMEFQTVSDDHIAECTVSTPSLSVESNMEFHSVTDDHLEECTESAPPFSAESLAGNVEFQSIADDQFTECAEVEISTAFASVASDLNDAVLDSTHLDYTSQSMTCLGDEMDRSLTSSVVAPIVVNMRSLSSATAAGMQQTSSGVTGEHLVSSSVSQVVTQKGMDGRKCSVIMDTSDFVNACTVGEFDYQSSLTSNAQADLVAGPNGSDSRHCRRENGTGSGDISR